MPACRSARTRARALAAIVIAFVALLVARPARADGDPDLEWWTIETDHFRVNYPRQLEPVAARVAALAETIQGRVAEALAYKAKTRTEIVITDDTDTANGSASAVPYNTIRLFVTAPD